MPKVIENIKIIPVYNNGKEVPDCPYLCVPADKVLIATRTPAEKKYKVIYYGDAGTGFSALNSYTALNRNEMRMVATYSWLWEKYFTDGTYLNEYEVPEGCGLPDKEHFEEWKAKIVEG